VKKAQDYKPYECSTIISKMKDKSIMSSLMTNKNIMGANHAQKSRAVASSSVMG
jgi:hypothetical protein